MTRLQRNTLDIAGSLGTDLKAQSRRRREELKRPSLAHARRNDPTPPLELVQRAPGDLVLPARNVRKLERAHVHQVAASITVFGFCDPVLIDERDHVLDGAVRVEAAKRAGLGAISCIVAGHLTPAERRMLRLALNRLQERGAWDLGELKLEFEELILEDVPFEITGFTGCEIDQVLLGDEPEAVEPGPLTPARDTRPLARVGDVFRLGPHRVICGDARDPAVLAALMGSDRARLVLTDEPYNVAIKGHVTGGAHREFVMASGEMSEAAFRAFNEAWIGASLAYLVEGGVLGTFIDWRGLATVQAAASQLGLTALNLIVWAKTNAGMGSLYRSQHELLPLFKTGAASHVNNVALGKNGRWRSNVWTYPGASSLGSDARRGLQEHPTVKPVAMLVDALLDLTHRDEVVLDPFLGSGSTLLAARQTGRRCRGVELDPVYVDLVLRRYDDVTGGPVTLESTGETLAELRTRREQEERAESANAGSWTGAWKGT